MLTIKKKINKWVSGNHRLSKAMRGSRLKMALTNQTMTSAYKPQFNGVVGKPSCLRKRRNSHNASNEVTST
jgi:hypothetical protein